MPGPSQALGWDALLARLAEVPRENGTPALHEAAQFLREALEGAGLPVELFAFPAQPYALRLVGVAALVTCVLYARLLHARRHAAALAVAVLGATLLMLQLDQVVPVLGWVGAQTQHHVVAGIDGVAPTQRLILTAHYDTKTDLLDHVERAPVDFLAVLVVPALVAGAFAASLASRFPHRARWLELSGRLASGVAVLYGLGAFLALSAGAFVPSRSPGALDDGASCALLVRLAEDLAKGPPLGRTRVEVALLSAEEVGVQGSRLWARARFSEAPELPTVVVNLEGMGASSEHQVMRAERSTLRVYEPAPAVVAWLDRVQREELGRPLAFTPYPGATDARSFLALGIPAATLTSREPGQLFPRGLHSARDHRGRIDVAALDTSLGYLLAAVRAFDRDGLSGD